MSQSAVIFGLEAQSLTVSERDFFKDTDPWGYILFARNCGSPDQIRRLTASLRDLSGRERLPILIDQEGGRVARLRPPQWRDAPPGACFGRCYANDPEEGLKAVRINSRLIAEELFDLGITVDCLPVLDVPIEGAHEIISDRAYSTDPDEVAVMGRAAAEGLLEGGVLPVIKHVPGHGRATADTHDSLPRVSASHKALSATDFVPFKALADAPMAMTAHIIYEAIDGDNAATVSATVIDGIIRQEIGFDGLLMTDDLSMKALKGDFGERTAASLACGCDVVLHCNGLMQEMEAVAAACPALEGRPLARAEQALAKLKLPQDKVSEDDRAMVEQAIKRHMA